MRGEQDKLEGGDRGRGGEKERERERNDPHMVSCWSLNIVTIDTCWGLLGLISRTQL